MRTILLTGAAGNIGTALRGELAGRYRLVLSDQKPIGDLREGETDRPADLSRMAEVLAAARGVDAIVHLGGISAEAEWEAIRDANIDGMYNLYEAARRNGVKRIVFATSNHAVGFYERARKIDHRVFPKPDTRYGLSKAFGEALGSLYADKYGLEIFNIRIGHMTPRPVDRRRLAIWISPRDLAQLVGIGIDHPDIRFEIVYGISDNARAWYDNSNAARLGYRPADRSEAFAEEVLRQEKPEHPLDARFQGGPFVRSERRGEPPE